MEMEDDVIQGCKFCADMTETKVAVTGLRTETFLCPVMWACGNSIDLNTRNEANLKESYFKMSTAEKRLIFM